jgi:hypothetical protein
LSFSCHAGKIGQKRALIKQVQLQSTSGSFDKNVAIAESQIAAITELLRYLKNGYEIVK